MNHGGPYRRRRRLGHRAAVWRVTGTHRGALFGYPATQRLEWSNASIFRLRDGMIVDYSGVWGALEAVQGMGVLPPASQ
jgi:hypothetical protein